MMKRAALDGYLVRLKSAIDKKDYLKAKRLGESVTAKLTNFRYTPREEFTLYRQMGLAYHNLAEYSHSVDVFYKAHLVATRHSFPPEDVAYTHFSLGVDFLIMRNIKECLAQLLKTEEYYQKYGTGTRPMTPWKYKFTLMYIGFCHLYNNDTAQAREVIEQKLDGLMAKETNGIVLNSYQHLKGEYAVALKDYEAARRSFHEGIKISEEAKFPRGTLEAQVHLVMIDILEGRIDSAIRMTRRLFREARRLKYPELVCEAGLLLSKCYTLSRRPERAQAVERRIRPLLRKLDIVWLYEKTREFERLYQQLGDKADLPPAGLKPLPEALTQAIAYCNEQTPYKSIIIGNAPPMREVCQLITRIGPTDLPVLIQGETGTGKELVAHAVHHRHNLRSVKPLLAFNCGAFPETLIESELFGHAKGAFTDAKEEKKGYIELASGGTLFMDEVANMSPAMQQKLLRVLEEKQVWPLGAEKAVPVDTRFIFASNRNLEDLVRQRLFREDLFYRINTLVINLPSLRDRSDDIPLLIQHFLGKYSPKTQDAKHITPDALRLLSAYSWPGNVRELENEIKRICVLYPGKKTIQPSMLAEAIRNEPSCFPTTFRPGLTFQEMRDNWEKSVITAALREYGGNTSLTARHLGFTRRHLYRKMTQLQII